MVGCLRLIERRLYALSVAGGFHPIVHTGRGVFCGNLSHVFVRPSPDLAPVAEFTRIIIDDVLTPLPPQ